MDAVRRRGGRVAGLGMVAKEIADLIQQHRTAALSAALAGLRPATFSPDRARVALLQVRHILEGLQIKTSHDVATSGTYGHGEWDVPDGEAVLLSVAVGIDLKGAHGLPGSGGQSQAQSTAADPLGAGREARARRGNLTSGR